MKKRPSMASPLFFAFAGTPLVTRFSTHLGQPERACLARVDTGVDQTPHEG
jgi:hypothetical protein